MKLIKDRVEYLFKVLHLDRLGLDIRFVTFLFVGGINTLFGYSIFALFVYIGFHYSIANLFSVVLGVIFNFFTTGGIVFKNTNKHLIFRFILVYSLVWFVNTFAMFIAKRYGIENLYIVGAILLLPCAILSFLLMKYFVFNKGDDNGREIKKG